MEVTVMTKIKSIIMSIIICSTLFSALPVFAQENQNSQIMQQEITTRELMKWQGSMTYHCGNSYVTIVATVLRTPSGTTTVKAEVTSGNGYIITQSLDMTSFHVSGLAYANASGQFSYMIPVYPV